MPTRDTMKHPQRRYTVNGPPSPIKEIREAHFPDVSAPVTLNLDGNELIYDNGYWQLAAVEGASISKKTMKIKERNKQLEEENQLLKFKVDVLMDMLATSNLDAIQLQRELENRDSEH